MQLVLRVLHDVVGQHRLADVVRVRQMATLTRTVACRNLVVTDVVNEAVDGALVRRLRVANRCVVCPQTTHSRRQITEPGP